ncbi:LOW QUALITY PROTEIN: uncharacterized protein [Lepeophtheirus salmonis]
MYDEEDGLENDQTLRKNKSGFKKAFRFKNFSKIKQSSFSFKKEELLDKENTSSADEFSTEEPIDYSKPLSRKSSFSKPIKLNNLFKKELIPSTTTFLGGPKEESDDTETRLPETSSHVAPSIPRIIIEDFDHLGGREPYSRPSNDFGRSGDRRNFGRGFNPYRWGTNWSETVSTTPESSILSNQANVIEPSETASTFKEESLNDTSKYQESNTQSFSTGSKIEKKIPFSFQSMDRRNSTPKEDSNNPTGVAMEEINSQKEQRKSGPVPMVMASIKRKIDPAIPKERLFKVLLIGDPGVGKTSFVQRYTTNLFRTDYKGTVGVDFALKLLKINNETVVKLQLWDVAGQERFTWMTRVYYRDARGCIIMFDLSNRNSFLNASRWKKDLDKKCVRPDGNVVPCLLLANKCDLRDRKVSIEEIENFTKKHDFIGWTETSAKNDLMVKDSVKFLVDVMLKQHDEDYFKFRSKSNFEEGSEDEAPTLRLDRKKYESPSSLVCSSC